MKTKSKPTNPTPKGLPHTSNPQFKVQGSTVQGSTVPRYRNPEVVASPARADHEVVRVGDQLIPVLGTVGGTAEQSRQTARNIEQFFAAKKEAA